MTKETPIKDENPKTDEKTQSDDVKQPENAEKEICELEINFNHEALFGDRINISGYASEGGETFFHATREKDGKEIISARFKQE